MDMAGESNCVAAVEVTLVGCLIYTLHRSKLIPSLKSHDKDLHNGTFEAPYTNKNP